jgi:hypothetical protein
MKNLIIILFAFLSYTTLQAQVADTTVYLKSIDAIKSQYIGKTFDQLEKDLKIKIVYFSPNEGLYHDISKETSTSFYFIVPEDVLDFDTWYIDVYWDPYLNADESEEIFGAAPDDSNWTPEAKAFYSKGIIKEIGVQSSARRNVSPLPILDY